MTVKVLKDILNNQKDDTEIVFGEISLIGQKPMKTIRNTNYLLHREDKDYLVLLPYRTMML